MRVRTDIRGSTVTFIFSREPGDSGKGKPPIQQRGELQAISDTLLGDEPPATMARENMTVDFGCAVDPTAIHPDLLGLAVVLAVLPWTGQELSLSWAVSPTLAAAVEKAWGVRMNPVDQNLRARPRPADGVPGLAYSGGVDSTAALVVMPPDAVLFFLDRVAFDDGRSKGLYRKEAALHACRWLSGSGKTVDRVQTDLEYVRDPVGFPVDHATFLPLVLLADVRRIDAAAFGTIAESAYRLGGLGFMDLARRRPFLNWRHVFHAVGLPLYYPVAGLSEVATSLLVRRSGYGSIAQSCIRGDVGQPCRRCWKCFRKLLVDAALSSAWPDPAELDAMFASREIARYTRATPIKYENVLTYALGHYHGDYRLLAALKRKVRGGEVTMDWLERYYEPALALVPEKYQAGTAAALSRHLEPMSDRDRATFEAWELESTIASPHYQLQARRFGDLLEPDGTAEASSSSG